MERSTIMEIFEPNMVKTTILMGIPIVKLLECFTTILEPIE